MAPMLNLPPLPPPSPMLAAIFARSPMPPMPPMPPMSPIFFSMSAMLFTPGIFFIFFMRSLASCMISLSLISPDFSLASSFLPTVCTMPINLPGFLNRFWNTDCTDASSDVFRFISDAVSSAISLARLPILPPSRPFKCSCMEFGSNVPSEEPSALAAFAPSAFAPSALAAFAPVCDSGSFSISCICSMTSSSLDFSTLSSMASKSLAASPNVDVSDKSDTTENMTSCRYFHTASLVASLTSGVSQSALKFRPGSSSMGSANSTVSLRYRMLKNWGAYVRLQCSNTAVVSMLYTAAHASPCSGNTVAMSATKSEMIFLNSGAGWEFMAILHSFKYFCLNQYPRIMIVIHTMHHFD